MKFKKPRLTKISGWWFCTDGTTSAWGMTFWDAFYRYQFKTTYREIEL